jgi:glutamyl-tRNA reductase
VTLVDLDALHIPIMAAEEMRRESIPAAGRIVEDEVRRFLDWAAASVAREAIEPLREAIIAIARREVAYVAGDSVAEAAARRIAAKMLARPMVALRGALSRGEGLDDFAEALDSLFDGARPAKRTIENARRASVGLRD